MVRLIIMSNWWHRAMWDVWVKFNVDVRKRRLDLGANQIESSSFGNTWESGYFWRNLVCFYWWSFIHLTNVHFIGFGCFTVFTSDTSDSLSSTRRSPRKCCAVGHLWLCRVGGRSSSRGRRFLAEGVGGGVGIMGRREELIQRQRVSRGGGGIMDVWQGGVQRAKGGHEAQGPFWWAFLCCQRASGRIQACWTKKRGLQMIRHLRHV